MKDIYFWRQCLVLSASLLYSLCSGFMHGFPAVLNQALTSADGTDIHATKYHASWIVAINGVGGLVGSFVLPTILNIYGRKIYHVCLNSTLPIGWLIIPFATNITTLHVARFIQGISVGGTYINSIIISEYVHPKRRGYFIAMKKAAITFGTLCCHAMDLVLTWRQIAIISGVPSLLAIIITLLWPESPSFLALKGRYTECETSFTWINGSSVESQRQLKLMIDSQKTKSRNKNRNHLSMFVEKIKTSDFQKSFAIVTLLTLAMDITGRYYFVAYVIQIMTELLENKTSALYFTLGSDLFTLIALTSSTIVIKYFNRRTLLFTLGAFAFLLMMSISALVYLKTVYVFSKYVLWLIAVIIILQCFVVNVGVIPVAFAIIGEIFPLEHRSLGTCASGLVFTAFYAFTLKVTPVLMENINLYGTYAVYGVTLAVCLIVLHKIVPETKDKSLQDIEDDLKGVVRNLTECDRLMSS